jgi:glycosyltransferase involved in cell wall biosynthesis
LEKSQIAVLIPVYNECKTIKKIIIEVNKIATAIVIDDGSNDGSDLIVKKEAKLYMLNKKNKGYDYSLNLGFNYVKKKFKFLITFDADGQHKIKDLKKVIYYLKKGYDIVCCERKKLQRFSEIIFSFWFRLFFDSKDPLCGLKGYSILRFKKKRKFSKFKTFGTEFLIFAICRNLRIKFVEIKTNKRKDNSRFGNFIYSNFLILKSLVIIIIKKSKILNEI